MRRTLLLLIFISYSKVAFASFDKTKSGGNLTIHSVSRDSFAKPAPNLDEKGLRKFTFGNKIFNTNWVTAPASVTSLDGLGPLFNRSSCSACHNRDGRGRPPLENENSSEQSILFRLSILDKNGKAIPHPAYGEQLNPQSINNVLSEGEVEIKYEEIHGKFNDGTKYSLRKPIYKFTNLNYGDFDKNIMFSPRVAPAVFGLGLLEAVDEKTILALSDPDDKDKDGISGKPNYVFDKEKHRYSIGRFGWKSNQPSILQQNTGAALGDIGITSIINPKENCTEVQVDCKKQISGGNPELSKFQLERLNFYVATLAVPARRDVDKKEVISGEEIFEKIGCASCHTPKLKTGNHKIKILSNQEIQPFTDLLLHDMGDNLADNRPDGLANGKEWRTAPLWGIGLVKTVNKHTNFLHDGRARNIEEAILWHGGEAKKAQENYLNLNKKDRDNLLEFLNSL